MEDSGDIGFDEFSVEMEDFEYTLVNKFTRIFNLGEGGSFVQEPCVHDGRVYAGCLDRNVYCIDAKSGELVWKFQTEAGIAMSSPVISDGTLYIGSYDYNMYALDAKSGRLLWKFKTQDKVLCSCAVSGGRVYFGSKDHNVYCIDAKTGGLVWKFRTFAEVASVPTVWEGKVYIGSYDRNMYCLDAAAGSLVWKFETQGFIFNEVRHIVHNGMLYFSSFDNYLRVVDAGTGELVWKFLTGMYGGMNCGPEIDGDTVYQTNREGHLYALTMDGRQKWKFSINLPIAGAAIHEGKVYIGTGDFNFYCLDSTGKVLWKFSTQGEVWYKAAFLGSAAYFTSWDCNFYCVDKDTGNLIWKFRGQGAPSYLPAPYDSYELSVSKPAEEKGVEDSSRKTYDIGIIEQESTSEYKSRITYQVSTQYGAKGKYQIDSHEEEF